MLENPIIPISNESRKSSNETNQTTLKANENLDSHSHVFVKFPNENKLFNHKKTKFSTAHDLPQNHKTREREKRISTGKRPANLRDINIQKIWKYINHKLQAQIQFIGSRANESNRGAFVTERRVRLAATPVNRCTVNFNCSGVDEERFLGSWCVCGWPEKWYGLVDLSCCWRLVRVAVGCFFF